jgi:hypothetical protein
MIKMKINYLKNSAEFSGINKSEDRNLSIVLLVDIWVASMFEYLLNMLYKHPSLFKCPGTHGQISLRI